MLERRASRLPNRSDNRVAPDISSRLERRPVAVRWADWGSRLERLVSLQIELDLRSTSPPQPHSDPFQSVARLPPVRSPHPCRCNRSIGFEPASGDSMRQCTGRLRQDRNAVVLRASQLSQFRCGSVPKAGIAATLPLSLMVRRTSCARPQSDRRQRSEWAAQIVSLARPTSAGLPLVELPRRVAALPFWHGPCATRAMPGLLYLYKVSVKAAAPKVAPTSGVSSWFRTVTKRLTGHTSP